MNFDPSEILYLQESDWTSTAEQRRGKKFPQQKGFAIDAAMKRIFGGAGNRYDPYDMKFEVDEFHLHEVKSTSTMKSFTISRDEFNEAVIQLENCKDTLYWLFKQLPERDEFSFLGVVRFSDLYKSDSIRPSEYDSGYFFSPSSVRRFFLS